MGTKYLEIEDVPENLQKKVRQNLAFRTGNFVWRVKFSTPLNPTTVNSSTMYLTSELGETLKTKIRYDVEGSMIEVEPQEPYAAGMYYYLNITTKVESRGGQKLKSPIQIKFKL